MATQKKIETVEALRERIERCTIALAADFRGLRVSQMNELRRALRDAGVDVRVVKNRLFLRAAADAGRPDLNELLEGPTVVVFGYEDIIAPAKAMVEFERTSRGAFSTRVAVLAGEVLNAAGVKALAELPPRDILIAQLAGALQGPVQRLVTLLNNALSNPAGLLLHDSFRTLGGLLDARARQLEGA